jgi:tetratricopeptide (TPR) repeat protein
MKKTVLLILLIIFVCALGQQVFAQTGVSLETELKNIEAAANKQGVSAAEKHDALVRLARLRQLSGDIEGAARNWLEAAAAIPGRVDDDALLSCAYCLAAMGEWDRAITALEPLQAKSLRARFLDTAVKAIKTGDTSALSAIADNPEYSQLKAEILFVLWKTAKGDAPERWRQRLIAEFPQTPEGRLAANQSSSVAVRPSPFWLFAGGYDSLTVLASETPKETPAVQAAAVEQTNAVQPVPQAAVSTARLQTGIFGRQANAQAQITNLKQAGFSPSIEQRIVNGSEMWAVTVPAGTDQGRTIRELRSAGFESFPVK